MKDRKETGLREGIVDILCVEWCVHNESFLE